MRPGAVRSFSGICVHRAEHLDEAAEEPLPEGGFDRPDHLLVAVRRQRAARPSVWTPSCWRTAHRRGRPTACTGASWGIRCRCGGMSPSWGRHGPSPLLIRFLRISLKAEVGLTFRARAISVAVLPWARPSELTFLC